jgi:hypothetical protein
VLYSSYLQSNSSKPMLILNHRTTVVAICGGCICCGYDCSPSELSFSNYSRLGPEPRMTFGPYNSLCNLTDPMLTIWSLGITLYGVARYIPGIYHRSLVRIQLVPRDNIGGCFVSSSTLQNDIRRRLLVNLFFQARKIATISNQ